MKYNTQSTDLASLQRELGGTGASASAAPAAVDVDPYDDDGDDWAPAGR